MSRSAPIYSHSPHKRRLCRATNGEVVAAGFPRRGAPRVAASAASPGPERTRMSHPLAARLSAVVHRGRVAASLVGALALVVALFAMTATAGARTHASARHTAKPHAGKHNAGRADDNSPGQEDNDRNAGDRHQDAGQPQCDSSGYGNPCQPPTCGESSGPAYANLQCPAGNPQCPAADDNEGDRHHASNAGYEAKGDHAQRAGAHNEHHGNVCEQQHPQPQCDSSGYGNPCHPQPECGQNYGPGSADHECPVANPQCPVANQGQGNAEDDDEADDVRGEHHNVEHHGDHGKKHKAKHDRADHHKADHHNAKNHKVDHHNAKNHKVEDVEQQRHEDDDAANCPNPCPEGQHLDKHKHNHGMCVPNQCPAGQHLDKHEHMHKHGMCVLDNCPAGQQRDQQGNCLTPAPGTTIVVGTPQTPAVGAAPTAGTTPAAAGTGPATATTTTTTSGPQSTVGGTQVQSATARLRAQTRCGTRAFRVTVSGRSIRRVTLFVAGRRIRTITVPAGRRSITVSVPVRRFGARRQSVQARVTFRNGAPARTLTASATRCAQSAVSPQFTG